MAVAGDSFGNVEGADQNGTDAVEGLIILNSNFYLKSHNFLAHRCRLFFCSRHVGGNI